MHLHRALEDSEMSEFLYLPRYFFGLDSGGTRLFAR
jgi:hypothetical protein